MAKTKVKSHTKEDGTKVKAHVRTKPSYYGSSSRKERAKLVGKFKGLRRRLGKDHPLEKGLKWQVKRASRLIKLGRDRKELAMYKKLKRKRKTMRM